MPFHKDRVRAKLVRGSQRQRRMYAEFARFVRGRRDHPALIAFAAHYNSFALQGRVEELFHRHEKRVHVDMEDNPVHGFSQTITRGIPARSGRTSRLRQLEARAVTASACPNPSSRASSPPGL